jgi:hypothetical protein
MGDIMKQDVYGFGELIDEWDEEMKSRATQEGLEGGKVVYTLPNKWTIRDLTTPGELKAEGDAMGHCVGSYDQAVASGRTEILSLRDPKNQPHVTIEYDLDDYLERADPPLIAQIQGKGNEEPKPEYQEMLKHFFANHYDDDTRPAFEGESIVQIDDLLNASTSGTEYGLKNNADVDWGDLTRSLPKRDSWRHPSGYDHEHGQMVYDLAKQKGEVPKFAEAVENSSQEWQEDFDDWRMQNDGETVPYPQDDDDENSPEMQAYLEDERLWAEEHPGMQAANHLISLIQPHHDGKEFTNEVHKPATFAAAQTLSVQNGGHQIPFNVTEPWELGKNGKGVLVGDKLHLWNADQSSVHHHDMIGHLFDPITPSAYKSPAIMIATDGYVLARDSDTAEQISSMHPDLNTATTDWAFSSFKPVWPVNNTRMADHSKTAAVQNGGFAVEYPELKAKPLMAKPWKLGEFGKGILYGDVLYLWNDTDGFIHHYDVFEYVTGGNYETNWDEYAQAILLYIGDDGNIYDGRTGQSSLDERFQSIPAMHPDLKIESNENWTFSNTQAQNGGHQTSAGLSLPWELGQYGKGILLNDKLHLWHAGADEAATYGAGVHHYDVFQSLSDEKDYAKAWSGYSNSPLMLVHPDGVIDPMQRFHHTSRKEEERIAAMHPDLKVKPLNEDWTFGKQGVHASHHVQQKERNQAKMVDTPINSLRSFLTNDKTPGNERVSVPKWNLYSVSESGPSQPKLDISEVEVKADNVGGIEERRPWLHDMENNKVFIGPMGSLHSQLRRFMPKLPDYQKVGEGFIEDGKVGVYSSRRYQDEGQAVSKAVAEHLGPQYSAKEPWTPSDNWEFNANRVEV